MANELDELFGPINSAGNSNSNVIDFFGASGIKRASKSFGTVGSAAIKNSKINALIAAAANNNEPVLAKDIAINKPLVKMINVLASIDSVLKQKLENIKIIERDNSLNARESQIEAEEPELEVIQPDAERVEGSGMGLLAAGGIAALLMMPPVQDAIKEIVDGVVGIGSFVTGIAKSINGAFDFLFGSNAPSEAIPNESATDAQPSANTSNTANATATPQAQSNPANESTAQPTQPQTTPNAPSVNTREATTTSITPTTSTSTSATNRVRGTTGGAQPQATPTTTTRSSTSRTPQAAPSTSTTSAPSATPTPTSSGRTSSATPAASTTTSAATGMPRNDTNDSAALVRLGRYLQTQGVNVSEHSAFDSSISSGHSENSRHYRDRALDLNISGPQEAARFDALRPQLEAAGYTVLWRTKGHYSHMHVSVGGPEGGGSGYYQTGASSLGSAMSAAANISLETVGKLFGILGSAIIKPGIPRTDLGAVIANAAIETNTNVAAARTPTPTPPPPAPRSSPSSPNINRGNSGPVQNVATTTDRNGVYYYLRRFGYQELSRPENVLNAGTVLA